FRLGGVEIQLWDADGQLIASTTTNADGFYQFAGVPPGTYTVRQIQPQGYFVGGQSAGSAGGNTDVANRISGVIVGSGQAVTDNDFCEVPPVEISGYVFQDGEAVVLAEGEELPTRLADIRPGVRDAGDTPLAGVTLELRNGVTGTPIGAETALPGVYAGGAIVAETDALGFYRFTGLAPGSYAVYQIQPAALVDGVDTPGTSSGVVFNPGEPHNQVVLQSLATSPMNDAIVRIIAPPGTISQENNFSEVAVVRQLIPIKPPVVPEIPLTPSTAPAVLPDLPAPALTPPLSIYRFTPVGNISVGLRFHTWHLSVIDAGFPRGRGLAVKETPQIWLASGERDHLEGERLQDRQWQFPAESSDQDERTVWFGIHGAEPIQGDFNGYGFDEIGVYCRGYWFIDINGNGEWDREDLWAKLGTERDVPVTGDWDGDGKDDIGVFGRAWPGDHHAIAKEVGLPDNENPPTEQPKNVPPQPEDATSGHRVMQRTAEGEPRADLIDHVFRFGAPGDYPVVGDWNGDGISSIGVFQQGEWHLDIDGDGRWSKRDRSFTFGQAGDRPIVGDFNGDGIDDLAVLRDGVVYLDANGDHAWTDHDQQVRLQPGETPVAGDWDGDGADEIATYSAGKRPNPQVARKAG
ncbi:MAG: SdrD B-like domain-containing protein, partial [Planctomycetota bacterium]